MRTLSAKKRLSIKSGSLLFAFANFLLPMVGFGTPLRLPSSWLLRILRSEASAVGEATRFLIRCPSQDANSNPTIVITASDRLVVVAIILIFIGSTLRKFRALRGKLCVLRSPLKLSVYRIGLKRQSIPNTEDHLSLE